MTHSRYHGGPSVEQALAGVDQREPCARAGEVARPRRTAR